jgi:hypothetical protein
MAPQGEALLGQCLLPLITRPDAVALVEKAFRLLGGGQSGEFGAQGMLGGQKGLLAVKDRRGSPHRFTRSLSSSFSMPSLLKPVRVAISSILKQL